MRHLIATDSQQQKIANTFGNYEQLVLVAFLNNNIEVFLISMVYSYL